MHVTHGEGLAVVPQFQGITCGSPVLGRRTVPGGLVLEDTGFPFTWRVRRYAAGPWGRRACPWATDDVCDTGGFPANTNTRFSPHSCNPRCFLAPSGSTTHGWACRMRPTHPLGTSPECRLTKSRVLFRLSASERPNCVRICFDRYLRTFDRGQDSPLGTNLISLPARQALQRGTETAAAAYVLLRAKTRT